MKKNRQCWVMGWVVLVFISFLPNFASALSEENYSYQMEHLIMPFYETGVEGVFLGKDDVEIHYKVFEVEHEKGALVFVPGRGMPMMSYMETLYDLHDLGFSVYLLDHRGQGLSGRMTPIHDMQYVKKFDDYVEDFSFFMDVVVNAKVHSKRFLIADSMGGAIATLYADKNKNAFDAAILSVPMFGMHESLPEGLASVLAKIACGLGCCAHYMPGQKNLEFMHADKSWVTRSEERYSEAFKCWLEDHPEVAIGGVSYQWYLAAMEAIHDIQMRQVALDFPVLLLQAENEHVVSNVQEDEFCDRSPQCSKVILPDAYHGLFLERDAIRNLVITEIKAFFRLQKLKEE